MKKSKFWMLGLMLILAALTLIGCGEGKAVQSPGQGEAIMIKHELGETSLSHKPKKIIVFDYGILDSMDWLGEDIIGLPKQSVPTYLDKYRNEKYRDLGSLKEPNFEVIYEEQPDLIIISGRQRELYDEFKRIAPTIYLNLEGEDYMNSFKYNLSILGQIFDKEDIIEEEIEKIEKEIEELRHMGESSNEDALFLMANDGNLSAYGLDSRFGILHQEFGMKAADPNIEVSNHGQKINFEYIVEKDPDYLFVMDRAAVAGGDISAKQVMDNELIRTSKAYKNANIIYLDAHVWYVSSGGITGTRKMIEEVKDAIR